MEKIVGFIQDEQKGFDIRIHIVHKGYESCNEALAVYSGIGNDKALILALNFSCPWALTVTS